MIATVAPTKLIKKKTRNPAFIDKLVCKNKIYIWNQLHQKLKKNFDVGMIGKNR